MEGVFDEGTGFIAILTLSAIDQNDRFYQQVG